MAKESSPGAPSDRPQRRYRRFSLQYPVDVKVDLGNQISQIRAVSNNLSLGGILLQSDTAIPPHCDVNFILTVRDHHIIGPTQIVGEGEVVRVQPHQSGSGFAIAVRCKRPLSTMEGSFPPLSNLAGNA